MFLSYRVSSDAALVETLYDKLCAQGVDVWWDKKCLPPGQPWEEGFADGVMKAQIFVPVLSKAALAPFAALQPDSRCDNVLLEYRLALELKARGELQAIFPVFVGEIETVGSLGDGYGDFFLGGMPAASAVHVDAVEAKLLEHLQRLGKGTPQADSTVKGALDEITKHQGEFLKGAPMREQIEKVVMKLVDIARAGQGAPSSPSAGGLSQSAGPILQPSQLAAMSLGEQPTRQSSMTEYPHLSLDRYKMQLFFHRINTQYPGVQLVHEEPYILVVDKFLSDSECDELVKKIIFSSEQKNSGSGAHGGAPQRDADTRTSMSVVARNTEVAGIRKRLAKLANVDVRQLQPTKLTRYDTGQHFAEHTDAVFDGRNLDRFAERVAAGNVSGPRLYDDRIVTIFVYLNDVPKGGRTRFLSLGKDPCVYETMLPALAKHLPVEERMAAREAAPAAAAPRGDSLDVTPVKGRAVLHFPTARRELACLPDYNADHEGEEAIDPKFILQQFIWSTAVDPSNGALEEPVRKLFKEMLEAASGAPLSSTVI